MHGTPSLPEKTHAHFPHPPNLCLQSPHPATDTLQGVAARRGRRGAGGEDAEPLAPGPRKMVSLRRHGGSDWASDRPFRFTPRTARRACLCGTQGGRRWRMRRHRPPGWVPSGRRPPSVRFAMEREADEKTERPGPETGEQHPRLLSLQRDRSRGHKPLNGALKGATYKNNHSRQLPAPRPKAVAKPGANRTRQRHGMPASYRPRPLRSASASPTKSRAACGRPEPLRQTMPICTTGNAPETSRLSMRSPSSDQGR